MNIVDKILRGLTIGMFGIVLVGYIVADKPLILLDDLQSKILLSLLFVIWLVDYVYDLIKTKSDSDE